MRFRSFAAAAVFCSASLVSQASTFYYVGDTFTKVNAPFTTQDFVSGTFSFTSPLPSNANTYAQLLSYNFTDGIDQFSSATASSLPEAIVFTGAGGLLTAFSFVLNSPGYANSITINYGARLGNEQGSFGYDGATGGYGDSYTSGTLSTSPIAATPEPSGIALLGTGILGLAGLLRKRAL